MEGLSVICAGLGIIEEDDNGKCIGYSKGEYCSENMKDLLRFLRRDDPEKRDVFKQVCRWNTMSSDLIPIILYCQEDRGLVLNAVKVIVFLTMPIEPTSNDIQQQMEYLWGLKSVIAYSDILPVIISFLESPLENLEDESFTEDDWKLVQLFLTLFRNILAIQEISMQQKAGGCAAQFLSIRDKCLELFFQENVMDLILALTLHIGSLHCYLNQDNLLLLEIFHCIFKGQDPELIATASSKFKDSKVEHAAENSVNCLRMIMEEEKQKRMITKFNNRSSYSQFSGTFTRTLLDGSKALFKGKPSASGVPLMKAHKKHRGPAKKEIWDHDKLASEGNIHRLLNEFVIQFVSGGYNVLMQSIREDIDKEHVDFQATEVVIFFEVAHFVTSFQYYRSLEKPFMDVEINASNSSHDDGTLFNGNICGPIAETLNEPMFVLVISKWRYAFEGLKQTNDYKLVSVAGSLVKIMICMLDLVLTQGSEDSNEPHTARILLYKLFYDQTEEGLTHFLFVLIKSFNPHKQSKSDLTNLVECVYLILQLLENLEERGTLRVSKKSRKKKVKNSMNKHADTSQSNEHCKTPKTDSVNTTSEKSVLGNTLGNDTVGNPSSYAELDNGLGNLSEDEPLQQLSEANAGDKNVVDHDGFNSDIDKSSGDELPAATTEVDLKVSSLVSALANHSIIQKLCWLLSNYKSNSTLTNHYIVSMLGKVCHDLDLSPMLYQLSFINVFYDILKEQKARPCKEYEEIVAFLTTFIRKMLRKMKSYPLLFIEILFRKTTKECRYINCGSILNEIKNMKAVIHEGEFDAGVGGQNSHGFRRSIADSLGEDDFETSFLNDQEKPEELDTSSSKENDIIPGDEQHGRIQDHLHEKKSKVTTSNIAKDSTNLHLTIGEDNSSFGKPMKSRKRVHAFSSIQEEKIKELFHQFKDHKRCSYLIARALDGNGSVSAAQITYKLKQLGLFVSKKKRVDSKMQLVDEVSTGLSSGGSDDETLSSLKARGKLNQNGSTNDGNHHNIGQRSHEGISGDDLFEDFASHKRRKLRKISDEPSSLVNSSVESEAFGEESPISERGKSEAANQIGIMDSENATINHSKYSGPDGVSNVNHHDTESIFDDMLTNDTLANSGEKTGSSYTIHENSAASRRRLKMLIDFEDDDVL